MPPKKRRKTNLNPSSSPETKTKLTGVSSQRKKDGDSVMTVYTRWLMKSEPDSRFEKGIDMKFGLDDLKKEPNQTACWDGVRNYQARNFLRDQMKLGHLAFFYHSNTKVPGIAGIVQGYVDHTQFDHNDPHYDSSSKKDNPRWFMVDVKYVRDTKRFISLAELKELYYEHSQSEGPLKKLALFTRARLSVQPLTTEEFEFILSLEDKPAH